MTTLNTAPNLENPDTFYEALLKAHDDLTLEETHAFNARLVLILANHIGDPIVLNQALNAARKR
ncbi:MAG: DUF2783 domain-containing protein [Pseudomonadota bacterium]